jgi:hypothetical protein
MGHPQFWMAVKRTESKGWATRHTTIVYRLEREEVSIEASGARRNEAFHNNPARVACDQRNAKLSVTDVFFANDPEWQASPDVK